MSNHHIATQWTRKHNRKNSIGATKVALTIYCGRERLRQLDPSGRLETILKDAYAPKLTARLITLMDATEVLARAEGVNPLDYVLSASEEEARHDKHLTKFAQYLRTLPV